MSKEFNTDKLTPEVLEKYGMKVEEEQQEIIPETSDKSQTVVEETSDNKDITIDELMLMDPKKLTDKQRIQIMEELDRRDKESLANASIEGTKLEEIESGEIASQNKPDVKITEVKESTVTSMKSSRFNDDEEVQEIKFEEDYDLFNNKTNKFTNDEKEEEILFDDEEDEFIFTSYANEKVKDDISDILKNMDFNLDEINIVDKKEIHRTTDMKHVLADNNDLVFNVVCAQSGYSASMKGLSMADINSLNVSTESAYQYRNRFYKIIYSKISAMSIPKPDYETWLNITSLGDIDTLLFGIYNQTFPDNNDFDITCSNCGKETPIRVDNQALIEVKRKDVYKDKLDEILTTVKDADELVAKSLVNKSERVLLEKSGIIVEIRNISLKQNLLLMASINNNTSLIEKYAEIIGMMSQISKILMPDIQAMRSSGKPVYYEITSLNAIMDVILNLSSRDGLKLKREITKMLEKYAVQYSIRNVECMNCDHKMEPIMIDMESILFHRIRREGGEEV